MHDTLSRQLTPSQKKAVFHIEGPLLILAGPGSGKTRVITYRIAALIDSGIRPFNICAITFTNKAADEMHERAITLGDSAGAHISTFHSLCVRILRQYASKAGINQNFSVYDDADQRRCIKQAVKDCELDTTNFPPVRMLDAVSALKNNLIDPDSFNTRADDFFSKTLAKVYARYQTILTDANALDFDDLLFKTAFMLHNCPDICAELGNRFKFLLIDEYQDTNHAQYSIARSLVSTHGNICATGDPDQSIYGWRGADIRNILAFEKDWPDATVVKLEENFRSTPNILEVADKLIAANQKRKPKKLIPTMPPGKDIVISPFDDEIEEAQGLAEQVKELTQQGASTKDIAVFYRVNSMSRVLEEAFIKNKIPYQIVRGVEFYSRKEIRDLLAYLKILVNPNDEIALLRIINTPTRGIGKTTIDKVRSFAARQNITFYDAFKKTDLKDAGQDGKDALENVNELINAAAQYDQQAEEPSLLDYLQQISLFSDVDAYDTSAERVALMTLHCAKGLEFENVFIVGVEDGLLPHERINTDDDNDQLEEERRLFFVGITRAKSGLNISYAKYRTIRGQVLRTIPSPFLFELGIDFTETPADNDYCYDDDTSQDIPQFAANQMVRHKKFGLGTVKEFIDMGQNSVVVVKFNSGQAKSLMLRYAKLEIIENA
jgi:DNA helicase-2/ATP-dependent DNA helicase PcrA